MSTPSEVAELFNVLESNRTQDVNDIKAKFAEMFNTIKDSWLINGLMDYYQSTGSMRAVDILIKVPHPHDKYLFDKLGEGLKSHSPSQRCDSLELLGHVVRRQPLWLHKITKHSIFKELLNLLKQEREIVSLMSGLLVLITLLPMIPTLISPFFQEIFDVFGRLAAWESHRGMETLDGYKEHLQLGLYALFHNLYGMYPCNFMDYLRREYSKRENIDIFTYTVKPMLETVKVHPLLITATKNAETDNSRWKKMEHHDVLIECRRFSAEGAHKQRTADADDSCFRSRCGTDVSSLLSSVSNHFQTSKSSNSTPNLTESQSTLTKTTITTMPSETPVGAVMSVRYDNLEPGAWFNMSEACGAASAPSAPQTPLPLPAFQDTPMSYTPISQTTLSTGIKQQDSGSPPEAAIEATPENTPIKDTRRFNFPVNDSPVVRALSSRLSQPQPHQQFQPHLSSSHSQPPSPLKKEPSPLSRMSSVEASSSESQEVRKDAFYTQHKLGRVLHDRSQQTVDMYSSNIPSPHKLNSGSPLKKISLKDGGNLLGMNPSVPNSPVPLGAAAPVSGSTDWPLAKPRPHKDGVPFDITGKDNIISLLTNPVENMREDKEIMELSKRGEVMRSTSIVRDAHIVFAEPEVKYRGGSRPQQETDSHEEGEEHWAEEDVACEGEDMECSGLKHGLHMPTSTSMLDFARRVNRLRFYSQCVVEPVTNSFTKIDGDQNAEFANSKTISLRKSTSCPNIKTDNLHQKLVKKNSKQKDKYDRDLFEIQSAVAFENGNITSLDRRDNTKSEESQTVDVWPMAYEYLYSDILQNFCEQSLKVGEVAVEEKNPLKFSPYHQVDRYIEILSQKISGESGNKRGPKEEADHLRQQLQLLQLELMYERHRREVHAFRNRRLLGRSRKNRAAEEQNQALKQQINTLQMEIEDLRQQVTRQNKNIQTTDQKNIENNEYWQHQIYMRECKIMTERQEKEKYSAQLLEQQNISNETSADVQHLRASLFDVSQQLIRANRKSEMCDRLMECIKRMQRELVMYGERDARYSCLSMLPTKTDALINKITQQYKDQLLSAQATLQSQAAKMEYLQTREAELDTVVSNKEQIAQDLKKQLRLVKEEYSERLRAVEDKYQSVKRINQRMEAHCLELLQRIPQSPQTISRDLTSGFSPQSSPLSASLASSEGHGPLLSSRVDEIRNLQVIVNAHETIEESTSNSVNNSTFEDDNH